MRQSLRSWSLSIALVTAFAACNETPVELPQPTTISISQATLAMTLTNTFQLSAQVLDQKGAIMTTVAVAWSSDSPTNTVSATGFVTAGSVGAAIITARVGTVTATTAVTVVSPTILIEPRSVQMYANQNQALALKMVGAGGQDMSGAMNVQWVVLDQSVATLNTALSTSATVTARAIGTTKVIAAINATGGKADTINVTVVQDSRGLVKTLNIVPDTVTFDATQNTVSNPMEFEYRVVDGNGTEQCRNGNALGFRYNTGMITTVGLSANAGGATCRIRITAITGVPGGSWLYASINSVTDSVFVIMNRIVYNAGFTTLPVASTIRAGDTVTYAVTVVNEANVAAPGVSIGFDVTGGTLSARSVATDAAGVATVKWYLPTRTFAGALIPAAGTGTHVINAQMEFPSGATGPFLGPATVVLPGPSVRVMLLGNFSTTAVSPVAAVDTLFPTSGTQCTAATCTQSMPLGLSTATAPAVQNLRLNAQSFDRFGNPRTTAVTFSSNDPAARNGSTVNGTQMFTTLQGDRVRTDTVTAVDGTGSASIEIKWTAGSQGVFQTTVVANNIYTGQVNINTGLVGIPGDTLVYNGGSGAAAYPTKTLRADTMAFAWTNGGNIDVGLVASGGSNSGAPVSGLPAINRASAIWGYAGFETAFGVASAAGAGGIVFLSDRDATKNANTGAQDLGVTATAYTRAAGSFITDGFVVGQKVVASGFGTAANNGVSTVTAVAALTLTVTKAPVLVVEAADAVANNVIAASNTAGATNPSIWDLYIRDRGANTVTKVTNTSADSTQIRYRGISINGLRVLIVSDNFVAGGGIPARPSQVYEVALQGGAITSVTNNSNAGLVYRHAQFDPGGSKIYLDVNDNGNHEIIEKSGAVFTVLKATGVNPAVNTDVGASFDPASGATTLGFLNGNIIQRFTLPSGGSTNGRTLVQYFTWIIR